MPSPEIGWTVGVSRAPLVKGREGGSATERGKHAASPAIRHPVVGGDSRSRGRVVFPRTGAWLIR